MKTEFKLKSGNILEIIQDENPSNPRTEWDNLGTMVCWHNRYHLGDNAITGKDARRNFIPPYPDSETMFSDIAGLPHPDNIKNKNISKIYADVLMEEANKKALILPLRLYDHSGITMSIGRGASPFDPGGWDSGQVGWIYMTFEDAKKELKVDENNMVEEWYGPNKGQKIPLRDVMQRILEGEVKTYDQYLTGDVYGFRVLKPVTTTWVNKNDPTEEHTEIEMEEVDSCWGFYGSDYKINGILEYVDDEILEEISV